MFILILGLGRTGQNLAEIAIKSGHQVAGTTRKANHELTQLGVIPIIWSSADGTQALPDADRVICAFPPTDHYPVQLASLFSRYPKTPVIQISSTGVFGQNEGIVDEKTTPLANDPRSNLLLEAEKEVLKQSNGHIVRAAGLYDEKNHPIHFIAGKINIKNPTGSINLVHRVDLAEILFELLLKDEIPQITHAVHPDHPKREEYYKEKAKEFNLAEPHFENMDGIDKVVTSQLQRSWRDL